MSNIELLAPAGNQEVLKVAINAGCDAVYLGGKNFGARSYANNFTNDELESAVSYAHLRQVRVYITINTIIFDDEWNQLHEYLEYLTKLKVDAVIVQDLGVLNYIRLNFPKMVVHASTQMNVINVEGAVILKQLGVQRVILARETPLEVVKQIVATGLEVEVFCHGALCFSYSGNCLMSYLIGGRSGNRGECAQPCRKKYQLIENNIPMHDFKALLSMKDLSTISEIKSLIDIGVTSLKIEGRMKSPEYVYTAVKAYRDALHGKDVGEYDRKLKVTFNREFTKGYLFSTPNNELTNIDSVNHQGIKIGKIIKLDFGKITILLSDSLRVGDAIRILNKEIVGFLVTKMTINNENVLIAHAGDRVVVYTNSTVISKGEVIKTIDYSITEDMNLNSNENYCIKAKGYFKAHIGSKMLFELTCKGIKIHVETIDLEEIAQKPLNTERIIEQLSKTNDSLVIIDGLQIDYDQQAFFRVSDLNQIRRMAIEELTNKLLDSYNVEVNNDEYKLDGKFNKSENKPKKCLFEAVVFTKEQGETCLKNGVDRVFAPFEDMNFAIYSDRVTRSVDNYKSKPMIHSLDLIRPEVVVSPYMNVANRYALSLFEKLHVDSVYLSPEIGIDSLNQLSLAQFDFPIGYVIYGRLDMMVTKHCFIAKCKNMKSTNCLSCKNNRYQLLDEYHNYMPVLAGCKNGIPELRILSYKTINNLAMIDKLKNSGVSKFLLIFTTETIEEVANILKKIG